MAAPLRVLIVADIDDDALLILRELRRGGCDPQWGRADTAEALEAALDACAWDIVIGDYAMPSLRGADALRRMTARASNIPFILVSGAIGEEAAVDAIKAGVHDYVSKDNLARLTPAVERELRDAVSRRAHVQTHTALSESRQCLEAFMDHIPAAAWIKDEELRYVFANPAFVALTSRKADDVLGLNDSGLWPPEVAERLRATDQEVLASGARRETLEILPGGRGPHRTSVVLKFPLVVASGRRFLAGVALDVTERELAEAALRDANRRLQVLSGRMIEIQEGERRRLAYELHDEIGQALTAVKIGLQSFGLQTDTAAAKQSWEETLAIVDRALGQVRNLSLDLRPTQLDDLGLPAALRSQLDRQTRAAALKVRFRTSELPARLHPDLETVCFRIFQEALTNAMRHACARSVSVALQLEAAHLTVSIADDGKGFDVGAARRRALQGESLGIIGMEERAMLAGGRLELDSTVGSGTRVRAVLPLRYREAT